jgi:hypothetical protein
VHKLLRKSNNKCLWLSHVTGKNIRVYKRIDSYSVLCKLFVNHIVMFEVDILNEECRENLITVNILTLTYCSKGHDVLEIFSLLSLSKFLYKTSHYPIRHNSNHRCGSSILMMSWPRAVTEFPPPPLSSLRHSVHFTMEIRIRQCISLFGCSGHQVRGNTGHESLQKTHLHWPISTHPVHVKRGLIQSHHNRASNICQE